MNESEIRRFSPSLLRFQRDDDKGEFVLYADYQAERSKREEVEGKYEEEREDRWGQEDRADTAEAKLRERDGLVRTMFTALSIAALDSVSLDAEFGTGAPLEWLTADEAVGEALVHTGRDITDEGFCEATADGRRLIARALNEARALLSEGDEPATRNDLKPELSSSEAEQMGEAARRRAAAAVAEVWFDSAQRHGGHEHAVARDLADAAIDAALAEQSESEGVDRG